MADGAVQLLIAYDGSPSAATAVGAAAALFPGARASVATVPADPATSAGATAHGLPSMWPAAFSEVIDELREEAQREADESAGRAAGQARALGLEADPVPLPPSTPAWAALLDAAHGIGADALVCGMRGRGAFARALLGSTSASLLHNTDLPLLVVPDGGGALEGPVVAAYDGSGGARHAIEAVGRLMGGRATVVVHGWEPAFHRSLTARALTAGAVDRLGEMTVRLHEALSEQAAATTADGVTAARAAGLDAVGDTVESEEGPWRAVAAAARAHRAAVIALGSRGLGAAQSVLLGSVSSSLVRNAELPVLVVPGEPSGDAAVKPG
jgi:nucleotide-binding universal stress UspA family protein